MWYCFLTLEPSFRDSDVSLSLWNRFTSHDSSSYVTSQGEPIGDSLIALHSFLSKTWRNALFGTYDVFQWMVILFCTDPNVPDSAHLGDSRMQVRDS